MDCAVDPTGHRHRASFAVVAQQDLKTIARKLSAVRVLAAQDVIFNFRFTLALPNRNELRLFSSPYTCSD